MTFRDYLVLAKPGIVLGNLVSVAGGFFLAAHGQIHRETLLGTLLGVSLAVASGCVFNNYIDRDIDARMRRTCRRALVLGTISPPVALAYGILLGLAGLGVLQACTNRLTVLVVLLGFGVYAGLYSLYLKRHSGWATLVGSLAGAAPPVAGYCAVSNRFDIGALLLLMIFSFWQMPHADAIGILHLEDYRAAGIPVLPVARGIGPAKKRMMRYIVAFTLTALLLSGGHYTGSAYLLVVLLLGSGWIHAAWTGHSATNDRLWARKLFLISIAMILTLNLMIAIDVTPPANLPTTQDAVSERQGFVPTPALNWLRHRLPGASG